MATIIPLRPFENALQQASRLPAPVDRRQCLRQVLAEMHAGRSGYAVAAELQRARLQSVQPQGGAA